MQTLQNRTYFNGAALSDERLHSTPSLYSEKAMDNLSSKYRFVPTSRVMDGLRENGWVPVSVEQQRVRKVEKIGYQKHLIRFRQQAQMDSLNEYNMELVLINSHDGGSSYQLTAGIYRRICQNGLVVGEETFQTIRFRHTGTEAREILKASLNVIQWMPELNKSISAMKERQLTGLERVRFAEHALILRYPNIGKSPIYGDTLLISRRDADIGDSVWNVYNRIQENLIVGGINDGLRGKNGRLRSMRGIKGIDSKVQLNKQVWSLAARLARGDELPEIKVVVE
jgi:hypothetical protein